MRHILSALLSVAIFCSYGSPKANSEVIKSRICYAIKAYGDQRFTLSNHFDRFAQKVGLKSNKTSPWLHVYKGNSELIMLTWSMGELGTIASLFIDGKVGECILCDRFENFITQDVQKDLEVKKCKQIKSLKPPELRR